MEILTTLFQHLCYSRFAQPFSILLVFFALIIAPMPATAATRQEDTIDVLILNSYHQGFKWTDDIVAAITDTMSTQLNTVDFHIEYMDRKRNPDNHIENIILRSLASKYRAQPPDIIITSDDHAFKFMQQYHQYIFPNVPVVFCGVNNVEEALSANREHFTGFIETLDISANIGLALNLLPQVDEIVIVSDGTPTGIGTRQMVKTSAQEYPDITFTYLNGEDLNTEEMLAKLRLLEKNSAVIAPAWYSDNAGNTFDNKTIYPRISEASPVPVFGTSSANLGYGVIGGKVNSGSIQGELAAHYALRILSGNMTTRDLPINTESQNHFMFDYRQLVRFGIDEKLLPPESDIFYRPFSFYQTYRPLVLGVIGVFCLFVLMIALLLINIRRLRLIRNDLSRSEENLRVTLHSIGDAVITTDTKGCITRMNRIAECLTGWTGKEATGKPLQEVFRIINTNKSDNINPATKVLATGTTTNLAEGTVLVSRNSVEYRIADSCASIKNDANIIIGAVLVFRDITKEYQREIQLLQSQKMEAIGQLAGGVAHDFNNMLGGIMGATDLLTTKLPHDPKINMLLGMITESAERAAGLTQKLLTFAHKQQPASSAIEVHSVLNATIALLENTLDRRIKMFVDLTAESSMVIGDPSQLQSIFLNLGINASHAMPEGGTIFISTQIIELDKLYCSSSTFNLSPGPHLEVKIRDTGHGISPENLPRIFEPFFTTKEQGKGTGLGLSAVLGVVQQHRGAIFVTSELGSGSNFQILLPLTSQDANPQIIFPAEIRGTGRILIIEDEHIMRITAKSILENLGYEVVLASNGLTGLTLFKENPSAFDLVILDMIMPEMSGHECFTQMHKIAPNVRIILSSGFSKEEDVKDMMANGLCKFIRKPFRSTTLSRAVYEAMHP